MKNLTLLIPWLFAPNIKLLSTEMPELPALNKLMSYGVRRTTPAADSFYKNLCARFGLFAEQSSDLPTASLSYLADTGKLTESCYVRCDPVRLEMHHKGLVMFDHHRFAHDGLLELCRGINQNLHLNIEAPVPTRWYLKVEQQQIKTAPIDEVIGKEILSFMPQGRDRQYWINKLNEIQMTMNQLVTDDRISMQANSLWLWGCGFLPAIADVQWTQIISDDPVAKGLAERAEVPFVEIPEYFNQLEFFGERILIVVRLFQSFNQYADVRGWLNTLLDYEQKWFAPMLEQLRQGSIQKIEFDVINHQIVIDRFYRYRFWRRTSLADMLTG